MGPPMGSAAYGVLCSRLSLILVQVDAGLGTTTPPRRHAPHPLLLGWSPCECRPIKRTRTLSRPISLALPTSALCCLSAYNMGMRGSPCSSLPLWKALRDTHLVFPPRSARHQRRTHILPWSSGCTGREPWQLQLS